MSVVLRMFQWCFNKDWWVFQDSFKWVSRAFERSSEGISGVFQKCFKGVSMKFQGCLKQVLSVFTKSGCFKEVSV